LSTGVLEIWIKGRLDRVKPVVKIGPLSLRSSGLASLHIGDMYKGKTCQSPTQEVLTAFE